MGRTNGKLKSFLKEALELEKYINLVYDPSKIEFELYLPRYAKHMEEEYERILKDWFSINNRTYINYSNGKAVLKAAMKKSPYLLSLKTINKKMLFRFSSFQEIEEKRKLQKDRQLLFKDGVLPSVASSDCSSGHDTFDSSPEPFEAHDQLGNTDNGTIVDYLFPHEDHSLFDNESQVNVSYTQENMNINSEKRKLQKDRQLLFKDEVLLSVASSDCSSGHDTFHSSPELFEAHDQLGNTDNGTIVDDPFPHEDRSLFDNESQVNVSYTQEYMNINSDKCSPDSNLEEMSTMFEDFQFDDNLNPFCENFLNIDGFDEVFDKPANLSDALDVCYEQTSIPEHTALHAGLGSATEGSDSNTIVDFEIKSENMASDQSVCAVDMNQPESASVNSQILDSFPLVQIHENQKFWICTEKRHIGSVVEYTCEPISSMKAPKADLVYYNLMIAENETTSYVFLGSTLWEPNRTVTHYLTISDGKYLLVFCE